MRLNRDLTPTPMHCPKCDDPDTRVIDSREAPDGRSIRRRRECEKCGFRFSTSEVILKENLSVQKQDGRVEEFDRNKILSGIHRALGKRPIDAEQIEMTVSDIERELDEEYPSTPIPSRAIGEKVMEKLKKLDMIAYIRFACVYKEFKAISDFEKELKALKKEDK
jgi:transcriptional repressor NrdR